MKPSVTKDNAMSFEKKKADDCKWNRFFAALSILGTLATIGSVERVPTGCGHTDLLAGEPSSVLLSLRHEIIRHL